MSIDRYLVRAFERLDEWRHLPAYRLEPRADVFFAAFMDKILSKALGDPIREPIIPEFPLRRGVIYGEDKPGPNASVKVDYLAVSADGKRAYLIELKTDSASRRPEQDDYLDLAAGMNANKLVQGVLDNAKHTDDSYLPKYRQLLKRLHDLGWLEMEPSLANELFETDQPIRRESLGQIHPSQAAGEVRLSKVYIQPLPEPDTRFVSFADVASIVADTGSPLGELFSKYLGRWQKPAGWSVPGPGEGGAPGDTAGA